MKGERRVGREEGRERRGQGKRMAGREEGRERGGQQEFYGEDNEAGNSLRPITDCWVNTPLVVASDIRLIRQRQRQCCYCCSFVLLQTLRNKRADISKMVLLNCSAILSWQPHSLPTVMTVPFFCRCHGNSL